MEFKTVVFKEDATQKGEFVGYASTWTRNPDSYGDVVAKGAFANTLKDWAEKGASIPALWGHRMDDPSMFIGAVKEAKEDDHGLRVRVALYLDNPIAAQVYRLLKSKAVAQMSFAFDILEDRTVKLDDGTKVRELVEVRLYEVSVVPVGANQDTSIEDVKSGDSDKSPFTGEQLKALKALADEWIAGHTDDDPQEGEGGSNDSGAETGQEAGKASRAEAVARINDQINALIGQEGA